MKTNFKHKCWYAVILALLVTSQVWGEVGITPSSSGWTSTQGKQTGTANSGITVSTSSGVYNTQMRVYKNATFTVTSSVGNITSIVMTGVSSYAVSGFSTTVTTGGGTLSTSDNDGTWTGSASTVTLTASGAQVRMTKVTVTTAAAGPSITTSVSSLSDVGYSTADFSQQVKSFTVSGSSLTADVTVTAPTNYEVCKTENGTYASSVSFTPTSGTLTASTVYVRLASGKAAGNYSGNVECTSTDATTKNVAVSGSVPFTVTWKANGTTHATTYVAYATSPGTALGSLPDDPDPSDYTCSPKAFYGWYDGASYSNTSTAPTCITTATKITADKTYNAVFATRTGSSKTYAFSITTSDFNTTSYAANNNEKTSTATATDESGATMDVKWTSNQVMQSSSAMQWQKNAGYIYNSTDLGTINSVTITSSEGTFTTYYGTTSQPSSGTQGAGNGYFKTSVGNATGKSTAIAVNFTKSNYTYSNYATTCCESLGQINGPIMLPHAY